MAGITSIISKAFSFGAVRADKQANENAQDPTTPSDDGLAQSGFLPVLANAMTGLSQQRHDEPPRGGNRNEQTCESVQVSGVGANADAGARSVEGKSGLQVEVNKVSLNASEGSQATATPLTSKGGARQEGIFAPMLENSLLQGEMIALEGERLPSPRLGLQTDQQALLSQERQSSSPSPSVGMMPGKAEAVRMPGKELHALQPSTELSEVPNAPIVPLTREGDGQPQTRGESPRTVASSARSSEAPGTLNSSLLRENNGTPQTSGERLYTLPSLAKTPEATPTGTLQISDERPQPVPTPARLLNGLDASATPVDDRVGTPTISSESLRTESSPIRIMDDVAGLRLPFFRVKPEVEQNVAGSESPKNVGNDPTQERSSSPSQKLSSAEALNQPLVLDSDRSATTNEGTISTRTANSDGVQQGVRGVFSSTLAALSSSAMLGNGERAFLYQIGREAGADRLNSQEPPEEIGVTARVHTLVADNNGSSSEPQSMNGADQTATPPVEKVGAQSEENSVHAEKRDAASNENVNTMSLAKERVIPFGAGPETTENVSDSTETEVAKPTSLRPVENVVSVDDTNAGGARNKSRNEKAPGNSHVTSEPEPALPTSNAATNNNAVKASDTQAAQSMLERVSGAQTLNVPVNAGAKQTGFISQDLGLDARTISSLITQNWTNRISNEVVQRLRDGVSELKLQLKPESLGEMTLRIRLDDDKVAAQIHVSQPDVKAALEATIPQLRDALASRGIDVHRVEIFAAGDAPARESRGQQEARQRLSAKRRGSDVAEERYKGGRSMGYNTIEIVM